MSAVRRNGPIVLITTGVAVLIACAGAFVAFAWPDNWEPAAQASLAGVLISTTAAGVSVVAKAAFDKISAETQHRLNVRAKILDTAYSYACDYLMPLAGVASEIAKYLQQYRDADENDRENALDGAFYSAAQYIQIERALVGAIPLPDRPRPLGLFLASRLGEDRVWDLLMPPWAFGIQPLSAESLVVESLFESVLQKQPSLRAPAAVIRDAHDPTHPLFPIHQRFSETMAQSQHIPEMIEVLLALNEVLNYEVRCMLELWYDEQQQAPALDSIESIPEEIKQELGIYYRPPHS